MATKTEELRNPKSCLSKAAPHEPVFVLRANDATAAQAIRHWAAMNANSVVQTPDRIEEALKIAWEFDQFQKLHKRHESTSVTPEASDLKAEPLPFPYPFNKPQPLSDR